MTRKNVKMAATWYITQAGLDAAREAKRAGKDDEAIFAAMDTAEERELALQCGIRGVC